MTSGESKNVGVRTRGRVVRIGQEFGFIESEATQGESIYFRTSWFKGSPPLRTGDEVEFELVGPPGKPQARGLSRAVEDYSADCVPVAERGMRTSDRLLDWAFMGHIPKTLNELAEIALDERWEFLNTPADPGRPHPILHSYLLQTFGKLSLERKVVVNAEKSMAAFNTGLVDARYEAIYAAFGPSTGGGTARWRLLGFCFAGEGQLGQNLVRHFNPLPQAAHYFDEPADVFYDTRQGEPEMDWNHVVIDRIQRYPPELLDDHWPSGIERVDTSAMSEDESARYWIAVGEAIQADNRTYRRIMNRVRDAVELSLKRTSWNFKTAVPQYYPPIRKLQLLLPICLVEDERTDMALAVEKTPSGNYLGHTMLPLDWAYKNARLICRPDSDWLDVGEINEGAEDEGD